MYDEILFPTDGSEASAVAFDHAVSHAHAYDARIHALYVVDDSYAGVGAGGSKNIDSLTQVGERVLEEFTDRIEDEDIEIETEVVQGTPYDEIVKYSDEGIDMIVMGTRGRSGIDKYLLGSVTEKVVRTAEPPVFTVRTPEK